MLTDEQKDMIGMALVPLYQQLERDVIADCARRLQKTGRLTETAEIMADALRAKGYAPAQIRREVMRAINADASLQREIAENTRAHKQAVKEAVKRLNAEAEAQSARLWEKAGNMAFRDDLSAWQGGAKPVKDSAFSDMIAAMKKAADGELKNLTKSLGFRLSDGSLAGARSIYTAEMNRALVKLTSGAFSWRQCVKDACRELGKSGLRTVDYDSGAARSLDTAAFNALRTASARLSAQITMHNVETTGTELVEVSSHWGAREGEGHANHAGWQGKIYAVHGATDKYPNLEEATGYPSDPRGLCGYNCRHTFYPYWEGISEPADFPAEPAPVEVNGREYTYYQATQEQRRREREIRAMKREANALEAAGEGDAAKELRSAIRGKALEYRQFSDEVGIRAKVERLGVGEGTNSVTHKGFMDKARTGASSPNTNTAVMQMMVQKDDEPKEVGVHQICQVDTSIYSCVSRDITTRDVIITDERIDHSNRHKNAYDKYGKYIAAALQHPDYIFEDNHPNTGVVVKRITDEQGKAFQIVLRLKTSTDNPDYKNSIISCWDISEARLNSYLRNKKVLYRADEE